MGFFPSSRVYRNRAGETGTDYVSLLPEKLTLRRWYQAHGVRTANDRATLFHEVRTEPLENIMPLDLKRIFDAQPTVERTQESLVEAMTARLEAVIEENWSPDLFHVIMHSSGYDSRMISWTIKKLAEKHGEDWLKPGVMFLCSRWEGDEFVKIMRHEGWSDSRWRVVRPDCPDDEYYAPSLLDFGGAWGRLGGPSIVPVNLYWYPVEWAQEERLIPEQVQMFTGCRGNMIEGGICGGDPANFSQVFEAHYRMIYCSVMFQRPFKAAEVVDPYSDADMMLIACSSSVSPSGWLREAMLNSMDVGLVAFENLHTDGDRGRTIARWVMKNVVERYRESWYGREVRPKAMPQRDWTEFQPFWSHWSAASLCEHLLREGYEIRVG